MLKERDNTLTVGELNRYVKMLMDKDALLSAVSVRGEISNLKYHSSGHLYFTLKDNDAAIRCVMFRGFTGQIKFNVTDGLKVIVRGRVSIYEKDGQYQFYVQEMHPKGLGDFSLQFEQIKE